MAYIYKLNYIKMINEILNIEKAFYNLQNATGKEYEEAEQFLNENL